MILLSSLSIACAYIALVKAQYTLEKDYFQSDFFDSFDFFAGPDPTNGFVEYNGRDDSLISSSSTNAQMRVSTQQSTPNGRPSIRISSKDAYKTGLIILDLDHMPGGICGTWPAFWTLGPDWPNGGEIDIVEQVNDAQTNQVTLHTGATCDIASSDMSGALSTSTCLSSNGDNTGCAITTSDTATFGSAFNSNGGGVYATDISASSIVVWFWPRDSVPQDIANNTPDPSSWSTPLANFSGPCDFSAAFAPQNLVFDTTFCGQWAGNAWAGSSCAAKASTCDDYVANNGDDFKEAYWSINGLKVYQRNGNAPSGAPSTPLPSPTSTAAPPPPSAPPSTPNPTPSAPPPPPPSSPGTASPPPPSTPVTTSPTPTTSEAPPPAPTSVVPTTTPASIPAATPTTWPPLPGPTTFATYARPGNQPTMMLPPGPPGPPNGGWGPPNGGWGPPQGDPRGPPGNGGGWR